MDQTTRRILISCAVIGLAACVCLVAAGAAGSLAFLLPARTVEQTAAPSPVVILQTPAPNETTPAGEGTHPTPPTPGDPAASPVPANTEAAPNLPAGIAQDMTQIEVETSGLRGVSSSLPVTRTLITTDDLRVKYEADFAEEYSPEEAAKDVIELSSLRLVEPDFDFYNFYIEFMVESVAGYYDTEIRTMYIVQGQGFGGNEKFTYSHEYVHFLQDMQWGIRDGLGYNDETCDNDSEACAGIQALIEGDATLTSINWLNTFASAQDLRDIQAFYATYESPIYDSAPPFMRDDLGFPYNSGQEFVQYLFDHGGWESVDAAYSNPPVSTEQIMHPERYPDDQPIRVSIPEITSTLGSGWQMLDEDTIGEWYTYLILARGIDPAGQLSDGDARTAAEGWGGDRYVIFHNAGTGGTVLVNRSQWDTPRDGKQYASAFRESTTGLFGAPLSNSGGLTAWQSDAGYTLFSEVGEETIWILAPDQATAESILALFD